VNERHAARDRESRVTHDEMKAYERDQTNRSREQHPGVEEIS
jgi:hypothetical protein